MGERRGAMFDSDEPVALIFEAVVRLVVFAAWSVFRLARFAVRRPVRALSVVGLVLLDRYAGHAAVLLLWLAWVPRWPSWRLGSPDSYRRMARPRLNELWLSLTYPRKWRRVAHRVGLVAHDYDNDRVASVRLRCTAQGEGDSGRDRPPPCGDPGRAHPRRLRPSSRCPGGRLRSEGSAGVCRRDDVGVGRAAPLRRPRLNDPTAPG